MKWLTRARSPKATSFEVLITPRLPPACYKTKLINNAKTKINVMLAVLVHGSIYLHLFPVLILNMYCSSKKVVITRKCVIIIKLLKYI